MRWTRFLLSVTAVSILAMPTLGHADTILVGTNLSSLSVGPVLCPQRSNCNQVAQQFTLLMPVMIHQIKVGMSGPESINIHLQGGVFDVTLGSSLGSGSVIGSDQLVYDAQGDPVSRVFNFSGLNISLGVGTYYLQVSGGNIDWNTAAALVTGAGTLGPRFECDPTSTCPEGRWDTLSGPGVQAFEIDGTATTPEPSTFMLLGTGILSLAGAARRRFHLHS